MTDNTMQWGDPLTGEQLEELTGVEPRMVGGDAEEWDFGATFLYVFDQPRTVGDVVFEPGQYIRHVGGNTVTGWQVTGDADEYVEVIEEAWRAIQAATQERCEDCGAEPDETNRTGRTGRAPTCPSGWH